MSLQTNFATALIDNARVWLGCKENIKNPSKSTCVNQIHEYVTGSTANEPWCAQFVWMITDLTAKQFNVTNTLPQTSSTVAMKNNSAADGKLLVDINPAPGSVFFYSRGAGIGHVGFVMSVNSDGTINTIEGNHSNAVAYGHRDPSTDSSFQFIHTENMAGGKNLVLGLPQNQILLYGGIGLAAVSLLYLKLRK